MDYTSNYKLKLPAKSDIIDIDILNDNFKELDNVIEEKSKEVSPIIISDTLDIIAASGSVSVPQDAEDKSVSHLLNYVNTTWGVAVHGKDYGTVSLDLNAEISLYIRLYIKDGIVYWDEYYEDGGGLTAIGTTTVSGHRGDNQCSFSYTNGDVPESRQMTLREAVINLLAKDTLA